MDERERERERRGCRSTSVGWDEVERFDLIRWCSSLYGEALIDWGAHEIKKLCLLG